MCQTAPIAQNFFYRTSAEAWVHCRNRFACSDTGICSDLRLNCRPDPLQDDARPSLNLSRQLPEQMQEEPRYPELIVAHSDPIDRRAGGASAPCFL